MNKILCVFALLLIFPSCKKNIPEGSEDFSKKFRVDNVDFQYFSSKSKVKLKNTSKSFSSVVQTRIRKDSAIWISVAPAFGLEAARVLITKDSLLMINRLNREFFSYNYDQVDKEFGLPLSYGIIESLFTGNLPQEQGKIKARRKQEYFVQERKLGRLSLTNKVSRSSHKLEKTVVNDQVSNRTVDITYSNFKEVKENLIPGLISLVMRSSEDDVSQMEVSISNQKIDFDKKKLKFPFAVPSKYERKH